MFHVGQSYYVQFDWSIRYPDLSILSFRCSSGLFQETKVDFSIVHLPWNYVTNIILKTYHA